MWEVELNGMYPASPDMTMAGSAVRVAEIPLSEEAVCENGGPTLLVSFVVAPDRVEGWLRYVSPPVDPDLAARIATDLESTVRFVHDHPLSPITDAPAIFHTAPERQ